MFPEGAARGWTMSEIDQMDVHFFDELLKDRSESPQETEQYLSEVW
ncbi:hypothetical protein [Alkalicoccus luteus]|nr:hypothetical protein [Alkalicoccus luteus]